MIAGRAPSGRDLELANEIHSSSVEALQLEARALQSQFSGMVHHPLNSALPLLIVPLITIILKSLKRPAAPRSIILRSCRDDRNRAEVSARGVPTGSDRRQR